jgi:Transglycosylase-like domain
MAKRALALTAVLVTATLAPPAEAQTAIEPPGPAPDLDESLISLELPSRVVAAPVLAGPRPAAEVSSPSASTAATPKAPNRSGKAVRPGDPLARIRACESGSNYQARSASGRYRGAYQFDRATFASVGGSGDPAAASPAEQDHRARLLLAKRGGQAWPVCAKRG